jgi:hypothetical protein
MFFPSQPIKSDFYKLRKPWLSSASPESGLGDNNKEPVCHVGLSAPRAEALSLALSLVAQLSNSQTSHQAPSTILATAPRIGCSGPKMFCLIPNLPGASLLFSKCPVLSPASTRMVMAGTEPRKQGIWTRCWNQIWGLPFSDCKIIHNPSFLYRVRKRGFRVKKTSL